MRKNVCWILAGIWMVMVLASCATAKRVPAGTKAPKELSRQFGVKVTASDNLRLYSEASEWLGVKHRLGGNTKNGIDCSGLVVYLYREVYGKKLNRSSADILSGNCKRVGRANLKEGDLVFFRTDGSKSKTPNHVGIYLKNNKFIHTSTKRGVMVSALSEPYYQRTWITGGRVK